MRNEYSRSRPSSLSIPWLWIWVLSTLVVLILIARLLSGSGKIDTSRPYLLVTPDASASTVFIAMSDATKNRITGTWGQPLYVWDKSVSIETGNARMSNTNMQLDLDEKTEMSYLGNSNTGDTLRLTKWRSWIKQVSSNSEIQLKNLSVLIEAGNIVMVEQNNQIYSTVYALQGDITIWTTIGKYTLHAGNRIMVSWSDLSNPWLQLSSLIGNIDAGIAQNPLFIRNNWKDILANIYWSGITNSGSTVTNTESTGSGWSLITILEPKNGSTIDSISTLIRWSINSKEIEKVTLNNQDTIISPVNKTFSIENFPISNKINDIVYKAYNADGKQVETGVITVYWSKQAQQAEAKLIPNTSPISSKDFRIMSPSGNPFVTTDRFVKVQWVVPKDTVSYIIVNDYRLQKYIGNTTTWYYFANMDNETMRDGINLYTIKFYNAKDEILYTQLFTIIKESKNVTLSGESSR